MARRLRVGPLNDSADVADELRRIYRMARREEMDMSDAKSLAWLLKVLVEVMRDSDLSTRVAELERILQTDPEKPKVGQWAQSHH